MFESIVVGVDGRQGGRDALLMAGELAASGAQVTAVHVDASPPLPRKGARIDVEGMERELAGELLLHELKVTGAKAATRVISARSAAGGLISVADELHADLLVIGRAHRGPLGRAVAGDTTRETIRRAGRPVAVATGGRNLPLSIGVGYDASAAGEAALDWAAAAAEALGRPLHITCAAQPVPAMAPSALYGVNWEDAGRVAHTDAERTLAAALERCGPRAMGEVADRRPADALLALSEDVGLLVVGTRGEHGLSRMLLGSTSDALVHRAACPVVAVPA